MGVTAVHYLKSWAARKLAAQLLHYNYRQIFSEYAFSIEGSISLHTEDMVDIILSGIGQVINIDHITLNPVNADIIPHE